MISDPIADMLTRIRNAGMANQAEARIPASRIKREIARVMKDSGFIESYRVEDGDGKPVLVVGIRYGDEREPLIEGLERVSKPSCRVYVGAKQIPRIRNGLGLAILSTPRGVLSDAQAREAGVGGELLARVW
jgi:small subunit ribosomal protein S8